MFNPGHERGFNSTNAFSEAGTEAGIQHEWQKAKPGFPSWWRWRQKGDDAAENDIENMEETEQEGRN